MVDNIDDWRRAGKIAAEALEYGRTLIKKGANVREICDKIDAKVISLGAKPAWPAQIALNHVAAHFTPDPDEDIILNDEVVCLDVGAHVNGAIGDNALSVDLSGKHSALIDAAKDALNEAIHEVKIGVEVGKIGKRIQEVIESYGFKPVKNLSGHGISPWVIHDHPSIPNYDNKDKTKLEKGQIIAIEPFATTGVGMIEEQENANLYSLLKSRGIRTPFGREIASFVEKNYNTLPFTARWLVKQFGLGKTTFALRELLNNGVIMPYPPLVEKSKGLVTVFEKTMLVDDKVEILTKI